MPCHGRKAVTMTIRPEPLLFAMQKGLRPFHHAPSPWNTPCKIDSHAERYPDRRNSTGRAFIRPVKDRIRVVQGKRIAF